MRWAPVALLAAATLAAAPGAAQDEPFEIYGMELDSRSGHDRLWIFADVDFEYTLLEPDPETLIVDIHGSVLDAAAPTGLPAALGGVIGPITARNRADARGPSVRFVIQRRAGPAPRITQRRGLLAFDFPHASTPGVGVDVNFRETRLSEVVLSVARETGERFIFDETLHGFVTIMVPTRVEPAEAIELLNVALLSAGFVAVPTPGGVRKIVPLRDLASTAPMAPPPEGIASDAPITTMVRLETAEAEEIASELLPFAGESSQVLAYPATNSLILAGSELRLRRLLTLARALDASAREVVIVRRLRHRDATELSEKLQAIHAEGEVFAERFIFRPDPRTNSLLIRVPSELLPEVRASIDQLDRPPELRGNLEIRRVHFVDPEPLAELLRELATEPRQVDPQRPGEASPLQGRDFSLAVDGPSRTLLMAGDTATLSVLRQVIDELDREPRRVFVELLAMEISADESLELSLDGLYNFAAGGAIGNLALNPSGGGFAQPGAVGAPAGAARYQGPTLLIPLIDPNGNPVLVPFPREVVTFTAEARNVATRVLLRPQLLVASGQEQQIFAGDNLPIPVQTAVAEGAEPTNPLQLRTNIQRQDVGITLRVLPTLGIQGGIQIQLFAEATRLAPSLAGAVQRVGPTVESRTVETTLRLVDGLWSVVGMGHQPELHASETGVPWLKDIPVLGALVRRESRMRRLNHLVIAVRAVAVRNRAELVAESIRRRLGFQRSTSRLSGLDPERDGAVLLLISTRTSGLEAQVLAEAFEADGYSARVVPWEWEGDTRYDVYLTGFASITDAAEALPSLLAEGWRPEIVPLPGASPDPALLHERADARVPVTAPF